MSLALTNRLSLKAIFVSILLHGIILSIFVFVMPVEREPHKPHLVFFGPILKTSELSASSLTRENLSEGFLRPETPVKFSVSDPPYSDRSVPKPTIPEGAVFGTHHKIVPRIAVSEFGKDLPVQSTDKPLFNPERLEYQPLRFHTK